MSRTRLRSVVERYEGAAVIGAPANGRAVYVTNSERQSWACARRGWFRHVERLRGKRTRPLHYGTAWHDVLRDVFTCWEVTDAPYPDTAESTCWACRGRPPGAEPVCTTCNGTGYGALLRATAAFEAQAAAAQTPEERDELRHDAEVLRRAFDGWLRVYGRAPSGSFRVVGTEVAVARPVLVPGTQHAYTPETYVVVERGSLRLAGTGEASGAQPVEGRVTTVRWPYYQIGRLDAVLQHRRTSALYVAEFKSASNPTEVARTLALDPQTTGYVWLLRGAIQSGWLPPGTDDTRVAAVVFDGAYNGMQHDPEPLTPKPVKVLGPDGQPAMNGKRYVYETDTGGEQVLRSPGMSVARTGSVPSWRFVAACRAAGFDPAAYADHVAELRRNVDAKLYVRDEVGVPDDDVDRYAEELYGWCVQHSAWRRAAARAETQSDLHTAFPRTPLCRLPGGRCEFVGTCLRDGYDARERYETRDSQRWTPEGDPGQEVIEW